MVLMALQELRAVFERVVGTQGDSSEDDGDGTATCSICLGVLEDAFTGRVARAMRERISNDGFNISTYRLCVSMPANVMIREHVRGGERCPSGACFLLRYSRAAGYRHFVLRCSEDALKMLLSSWLRFRSDNTVTRRSRPC